ncbi:MAG: hypothetical protein QM715_00350 [Nibricoccus sp.]
MSPDIADEEFRLALNTVRATYNSVNISDTDLDAVVAVEENRVADAAVLAQLISSQLAAISPAGLPVQKPAFPASETAASLPTPIPFPSGGSAPSLNVADLIDGMLAQEKRDLKTSKKY